MLNQQRWERRRLLLLVVEAGQMLSFSVSNSQQRHPHGDHHEALAAVRLDADRRHELRLFLVACFEFDTEREDVLGILMRILSNHDLIRIIAAFL